MGEHCRIDGSDLGRELDVIRRLTGIFFSVVPERYATYCVVGSNVAAGVLRHHGIAAEVVPCQLWHVTRTTNRVIGFVGKGSRPGRWDGHAVCMTKWLVLDHAIRNLERDFQLSVPRIAIADRFQAPSQVMARLDLSHESALWWHRAPDGMDATLPEEPGDLIAELVRGLVAKLQQP